MLGTSDHKHTFDFYLIHPFWGVQDSYVSVWCTEIICFDLTELEFTLGLDAAEVR